MLCVTADQSSLLQSKAWFLKYVSLKLAVAACKANSCEGMSDTDVNQPAHALRFAKSLPVWSAPMEKQQRMHGGGSRGREPPCNYSNATRFDAFL